MEDQDALVKALLFDGVGLDREQMIRRVGAALHNTDDGELFLEARQSEGFVWDDGKLKSANYDTSHGFGLRAVAGEAVGYAHSVVFDAEAFASATNTVRSVLHGYQGKEKVIDRASSTMPSKNRLPLYRSDNPLESQTFEHKINLLQRIDAYVRGRDPRVHQVSVSLGASWQVVAIIRADGAMAQDVRPMVRLNISVVVRQGDRIEAGSSGGGGRVSYDAWVSPDHWQPLADEALRKALVNVDAVEAPAGEMTVVLGPGWPAVMLHEAVGHGLEGDFNRKRTSVFSGLMGQRVAAKGVTVVDDGTLRDRRGSIAIDDEGTVGQCTTLIEDGVLVGYMQDRLNARLMGGMSTGNGRRESFACQPYPRMTNTMMLSGTHTHDEIIASVKKGVYAADFGGGQVDITSGKFVFTATEAYAIEDGKITHPVKGASLVGTGADALHRITMIGNDSRLDGGVGTCGKNGQSVPVGVGQPTLRLETMTVGGRATT